MNDPAAWQEVLEERQAWRRTFNEESTGTDLAAPCPECGSRTLHRWYLLEDSEAKVLRGRRFSGRGRLWEWCSTCRTFEHYRDGFVPDWWTAPFDVAPDRLRYDPGPIEEARSAAA